MGLRKFYFDKEAEMNPLGDNEQVNLLLERMWQALKEYHVERVRRIQLTEDENLRLE